MRLSSFVQCIAGSLVLGLSLMGGCLGSPGDVLSENGTVDETLPSRYTGKVYRIGSVSGRLAEEMEASVSFTAYTAGAADAPVVLPGDGLANLSEAERAGLAATYAAFQPIILFDATADQINALRQVLGLNGNESTLPEGVDRAEIYALDSEPDQEVWQWVQYPPREDELNPDNETDQQTRVSHLIDWLDDNQNRKTLAELEADGTPGNAKDEIANQLTQLASAFVDQRNFSEFGNSYQVCHFIYSFHSVTTGEDWFYIQQQARFTGSGAYTGMQENYYYNNCGNAAFWYMDTIDINSTVKEFARDSDSVGLIRHSPETANNTEKVTSSMNYSVGGEVSLVGEGVSGKLKGGVSISSSRSFAVSDCTVINCSLDGVNNAHWQYTFKRCEASMPFTFAYLSGPPNLSVSAFQPVNQWVWRFGPKVREEKPNLHVAFRVNLVGTTARTFLFVPLLASAEHRTLTGSLFEYDLSLPLPPKL